MSLFYGRNTSVSSALSKYSYIPTQISAFCGVAQSRSLNVCDTRLYSGLKFALGNITKSHPSHTVQGFQRIRDFALQHQAGVILGKKAVFVVVVSGKLIKIFLVVWSITKKLKKRILTMSNIVGLFGSASHVLKITEQRKQEIALAATEWTKGVCRLYFDYSEYHKDFVGPVRPKIEYIRGYVYMITLTNSHNASHSLEFQREGQKRQ